MPLREGSTAKVLDKRLAKTDGQSTLTRIDGIITMNDYSEVVKRIGRSGIHRLCRRYQSADHHLGHCRQYHRKKDLQPRRVRTIKSPENDNAKRDSSSSDDDADEDTSASDKDRDSQWL